MQERIVLPHYVRTVLEGHAERAMPNESCALLFGRGDEAVSDVFLTGNADESPVSFSISGEETLRGYEAARRAGLEVVGIFHSHPSSKAYPSQTDRRFMEINPVVWTIYSGTDRDFRAYVLSEWRDIKEIQVVSEDWAF